MAFNRNEIVLVSGNNYLGVALRNLTSAITLNSSHFTREYIYQCLGDAIVILDLSNIQDITVNIKNLGVLRMISPQTKIILLKTSVLNFSFLNKFCQWDADAPLLCLNKVIAETLSRVHKIRSNSDVCVRSFTPAQVSFLYLYSQGLTMPDIAEKLDIPIKTAYSRKVLLWRRMDVRREINITYLLPNIKNFLQTYYSKELDWCGYQDPIC